MNLYACYEKMMTGNWELVVYHNDKPPKTVNGSEVTRTEFLTIDTDSSQLVDEFNNPLFGKIKEIFPEPIKEESN